MATIGDAWSDTAWDVDAWSVEAWAKAADPGGGETDLRKLIDLLQNLIGSIGRLLRVIGPDDIVRRYDA